VKIKRSDVLEEFYAALDERMAHPRFISSHMRLVLARHELEKYVMVPWRKRVWRQLEAWVWGLKSNSPRLSFLDWGASGL
jgi:hypothetical protein